MEEAIAKKEVLARNSISSKKGIGRRAMKSKEKSKKRRKGSSIRNNNSNSNINNNRKKI